METHKDLNVWKKAMDLVTEIYTCTRNFPKVEQFGLVSQMQRAAVSVPSNIAEGAGRHSNKEYIRFLYIALGSLTELDTQLSIAQNLKYLSEENKEYVQSMIDDTGKMLNGLIAYKKTKV